MTFNVFSSNVVILISHGKLSKWLNYGESEKYVNKNQNILITTLTYLRDVKKRVQKPSAERAGLLSEHTG